MKNKFNFNEIGSQFRGLNQKDPSTWPTAPKAVMMVCSVIAILVAGYFLDSRTQLEKLAQGQQAEIKLKSEYAGKYKQAINLDLYKKQLDEVNKMLDTTLRQLPNRSQMETLITDINNAGVSRNLSFELFKPAVKESTNEIYAELPISIKVTGKYHDMGAFVAGIGQLSRIVTINDITINTTPVGTPSATLLMEATAKTFRYLDEEELALAKAERSKKDAKNKPKSKSKAKAKADK